MGLQARKFLLLLKQVPGDSRIAESLRRLHKELNDDGVDLSWKEDLDRAMGRSGIRRNRVSQEAFLRGYGAS